MTAIRISGALFLFVTIMVLLDLYHHVDDFRYGDIHAVIETFVAIIGILGLASIFRYMTRQQVFFKQARFELGHTHARLKEVSAQHSKVIGDFSQLIQEQFERWNLTPSEAEVALLLLKGLSLDEIAGVRDTREKTVRQQASSIYKKAEVSGRHELAAYFFEDLLTPTA
jgi:DNA-binding CsgD family transcriptional regulator